MQDVINQIIENFDFVKVHKAMVLLNWTYSSSYPKVPSVGKLVLTAKELLVQASKGECGATVESGGFKTSKYIGEEDETYLSLEFHLETCQSCQSWADEEINKKKE